VNGRFPFGSTEQFRADALVKHQSSRVCLDIVWTSLINKNAGGHVVVQVVAVWWRKMGLTEVSKLSPGPGGQAPVTQPKKLALLGGGCVRKELHHPCFDTRTLVLLCCFDMLTTVSFY